MHIQLVMQLSDTITDRVVYSIHFLLNEWNGDDEEKNDQDVNVYRLERFKVCRRRRRRRRPSSSSSVPIEFPRKYISFNFM